MKNRLEIILRFMNRNQTKFVVLLLTVAVLDYLAKFPYINTFLLLPYPWNSLIILWIVTAILFRLDERFCFSCAFVILCAMLILSLLGKGNFIETLGNLVYGLLLLGFIEIVVRHVVHHGV